MRFSETVKNTDPDLIVSKLHDAWLAKNDDAVYNQDAIDLAVRELTAKQRDRTGTLSASSLGECNRYQQFVFLGMPRLPPDQKNAMKMHNGSFMHLRWQMAGLSAGWLKAAEVTVRSDEYRIQGTMDGVLYDDSILELKSINNNGFGRVQAFGPLNPHLFQMATYMMCTPRTSGVFIYENKDTQEYREVVVTEDELPILQAKLRADSLWAHIEKKELFEPLNDCIDKKGWKYNSCPFRDRCLKIHKWEEVTGE